MDYGSPFEQETDDLRLGQIFRRAGLRVAGLIDSAPAIGLLVLEDLGETSLESLLEGESTGDAPPAGLIRAVELAAEVARDGTPVLAASERAAGPALDRERFRF